MKKEKASLNAMKTIALDMLSDMVRLERGSISRIDFNRRLALYERKLARARKIEWR